MSGFKLRLEVEQSELESKLLKLNDFIDSERFKSIDDVQQALLKAQAQAMSTYLVCLDERLKRL